MKITLNNYKKDKYYLKIVNSVEFLLSQKKFITPVELFVNMGLLDAKNLSRWRQGKIPYLEKVIQCNLSKASRILRILRFHAHDLNMKPSTTHYKHKGHWLKFSKTGDKNIEEAYSRHFINMQK